MAKNFKIKKQKKVKTWLSKIMFRVVLPAFLGGLAVVMGIIFLLLALNLPETVYVVATAVYFVLLFTSAGVIIFVVIPRCRAAQALRDLENYDFTPYEPKETETFTFFRQTEKYYFTPSPFDDDEGVVPLADGVAADNYFSQFAPERFKQYELLGVRGEFIPFVVYDFNMKNFFGGSAEKRTEGEFVTVTVTEHYDLTFENDGVHFAGNVFPYARMQADVLAYFVNREAQTSARLTLLLDDEETGEEYLASFAFGTRIAAIIDKHKIAVANREVFDRILADPQAAFRTIGLKMYIKTKSELSR